MSWHYFETITAVKITTLQICRLNTSHALISLVSASTLHMSALLQLLSDVGITRDLVPVGREVAGVVLQGCKSKQQETSD